MAKKELIIADKKRRCDMQNIIMTELGGLYGNEVIKEMNEIIKLYDI